MSSLDEATLVAVPDPPVHPQFSLIALAGLVKSTAVMGAGHDFPPYLARRSGGAIRTISKDCSPPTTRRMRPAEGTFLSPDPRLRETAHAS